MQGKRSSVLARCIFTLLLVFVPFQASSVPDSSAFYLASSTTAADRCRTTDCMCRVRPGPRPAEPQTIEQSDRRYSAYFSPNVHELSSTQQRELGQYLDSMQELYPSARSTIMAYTDGCGSSEYNAGLARRRLTTAVDAVSEYFRISSTMVHPEAPPECPLQEARRIDVITHTSRTLTTSIDKIPADVYLIDASGSMWEGWRRWTDIINASYKPGSRIYVSMKHGCRRGQVIDSVSPQGGTEIWWSYYSILDTMQPGETLVIVSDFESDVPLQAWESRLISQKVQQKQVKVVAIRP